MGTQVILFQVFQRAYLEKYYIRLWRDATFFNFPSSKLFLAEDRNWILELDIVPNQELFQNFANDLKAPTLFHCQQPNLHC